MLTREPFAAYTEHDAVHWSALSRLRTSPAAYREFVDHGSEDTPTLALGRATHTAILEPERFSSEVAVFDGVRRGKEWEAFKAENAGRTLLNMTEYNEMSALQAAVRGSPLAMAYLASGTPETSIRWTDEETGIACKGRADWLAEADGRRVLVDLKTARSIDGRMFGKSAFTYGYHCQLAFYHDGLFACRNPVDKVVIVAVEKAPPYDVAVFVLDEDCLWAGREEYRKLLTRLARCLDEDRWPGRYEEEQALVLPAWAFHDEDEEEDETYGLHVGAK